MVGDIEHVMAQRAPLDMHVQPDRFAEPLQEEARPADPLAHRPGQHVAGQAEGQDEQPGRNAGDRSAVGHAYLGRWAETPYSSRR